MGASGVKSNPIRESTKPQSSTKPFTTGQKIAVALAIIGALALVLGVLGQFQVGKLAEMGSDWNLGLMIGGGVMIILQVGYLLIQMRKKPATPQLTGGAPAHEESAATGGGATAAASAQAAQGVSTPPQRVVKAVGVTCQGQRSVFAMKPTEETPQGLKDRTLQFLGMTDQSQEFALYYKEMEIPEDHFHKISDYVEGDSYEFTLRKKSEIVPETITKPLDVFVMTLTARKLTFNLDAMKNPTVRNVKEKVCTETGTPPSRQRLIYAGKELEDDKTLAEYNIQHESTLHLVLRLAGSNFNFVT